MAIVTARQVQKAVELGFERMKRFRKARAMFIKEYVGQYYRENYGLTNDEPINLIFNTISIFVPNLVMRSGISKVTTPIIPYKQYAELLGLTLDQLHEKIKLKQTLRKWVVDSFFGLSVLKTGICSSEDSVSIDDVSVDPGQIYTAHVDLDDFAIDAVCNDIYESTFYANRVRTTREVLLNIPGVNEDLVKRIPRASLVADSNRVESITQRRNDVSSMFELQDTVNVIEVWVPDAGAMCLIPDPKELQTEDFIHAHDYYGPKDGPYTFFMPTPTAPGSPFPVAPIGIWYDLHVVANKIFKKVIEQSLSQRDVIGYDPAHADEVLDLLESADGDSIAMTDPSKVQMYSFGGQNEKNTGIIQQLQVWFNYIAGNPNQLAGLADADTATQSDINQTNATVRLSDMKDLLYDATAEVSHKEAFYIHNDPLIEIPLSRRLPGGEEQQVVLTPEQIQGDFLDYTFHIKAKSLSRLDPTVRAKRIVEFGTKILPGLANSMMICMQSGVQFNLPKAALQIAEEMEILDEITDWFNDPEFAKKIELMMLMGPQPQGKGNIEGQMQNGGTPSASNVKLGQSAVNSQRQERAGMAQSQLPNKIGA